MPKAILIIFNPGVLPHGSTSNLIPRHYPSSRTPYHESPTSHPDPPLKPNTHTSALTRTSSAAYPPPGQITDRVSKLLADNKKLAKNLKSAAKKGSTDIMSETAQLLKYAKKIGDTSIVVGTVSPCPIEQARQAIDSLKKKAKSAAIVFGIPEGEDKVMLLAAMTDDLIKKGPKAGDLIKQIAPIVDGRGRGKPKMAQAGGKNPAKLSDALAKATELIKAHLA